MERLTNEETTLELKKDMRRMLKKGFEAAPIALRYIALSKYEDTGLSPDEIERLQEENAFPYLRVKLLKVKTSCKLKPDENCAVYQENAELKAIAHILELADSPSMKHICEMAQKIEQERDTLEIQLSKAVELIKSAQCYSPEWAVQHAAAMRELIGGNEK